VFWLKVRTPARLANHLSRSFWRSSLQTTSRSEALCAARSVRAALDQGFVAVGVGMRLGMLTEAQGEAVITALVRKCLAEAESRRSLAGPRGEAVVEAARRDHLAEAAAWRDVLRRNDLSIVAPLVADSAALAGLADPDQALVPDLLREAARTLAAVADENAEREDGFYAGDRARLLARLDADQGSRTSTRESIVFRPRAAEAGPRKPACIAVAAVAAEPLLVVRDGSARSDLAATEPVTRAVEPTTLAVAAVAQGTPLVRVATRGTIPSQAGAPERALPPVPKADTAPEPAPTPVIAPTVESAVGRPVAPTAPAEAPDAHDRKAVLPEAAAEPVAPRQRRRRQAPRRAERRPVRSEETERLRRLALERYLDLTLEEGFALTRDISSKGGTDASWMRNSARGFDAAGTLALSFFGRQTRVRRISFWRARSGPRSSSNGQPTVLRSFGDFHARYLSQCSHSGGRRSVARCQGARPAACAGR
jgi:hypothetical protein